MKVCVYLEYEKSAERFGDTGIGNAAKMQRIALEKNGIDVTTNPDDDYDIIDINPMGFFKALSVAKRARKRGKKVVVHAHTTPENFRNSFWFADMIGPWFDHQMVRLYNSADIVVCVGEHMKNILTEAGVKKPMAVAENAIDIKKFEKGNRQEFRRKYGMEGLVIFCTGLVIPRKGIETFVDVARMMPENQFFWFGPAGRGLLFSNKAKRIIKNAPPNVKFTGYVNDIVSAYAAGDIFFFPTLNETFGLSLAEALAAQKASVVRDIPALDWIHDGKECLKAKTNEGFAEKLRMFIKDEKLRESFGIAGRKKVEKYSPERIGAKLRSIYEGLLEE